jgi:transcriptional regulator with XRE-family HTH domain
MRAWRDYAGLSQAAAAAPLGWTRQAISEIELGRNDISVANLHVLCLKSFGCSLRRFFGPLPSRRCAA